MLTDPQSSPRAQQREHEEPSEAIRPIPALAALLTVMAVLFGVGYILFSEPFGRAELGDRRTIADLGPRVAVEGQAADGGALYAAQCAACHQATGKGVAGVFPPLDGSEWVIGDERVLANILLHGIEGEIEVLGAKYQGTMPSFQRLSDVELAALATWLRAQWSNGAAPVAPTTIAQERAAERRSAPFESGAQLKALVVQPGT
ncbi:MAG TPA: cytochrome c [Zeimonas sp.]|nr:cytochrome c [Zeimonas sp.]